MNKCHVLWNGFRQRYGDRAIVLISFSDNIHGEKCEWTSFCLNVINEIQWTWVIVIYPVMARLEPFLQLIFYNTFKMDFKAFW